MAYYWLTPPSRAVFIISVFLALLALLVKHAHVAIPVVSAHTFETLLVAFLLLLAGNIFKGFWSGHRGWRADECDARLRHSHDEG